MFQGEGEGLSLERSLTADRHVAISAAIVPAGLLLHNKGGTRFIGSLRDDTEALAEDVLKLINLPSLGSSGLVGLHLTDGTIVEARLIGYGAEGLPIEIAGNRYGYFLHGLAYDSVGSGHIGVAQYEFYRVGLTFLHPVGLEYDRGHRLSVLINGRALVGVGKHSVAHFLERIVCRVGSGSAKAAQSYHDVGRSGAYRLADGLLHKRDVRARRLINGAYIILIPRHEQRHCRHHHAQYVVISD